MTPMDYYRDLCHQGRITEDQQQLHALQYLQEIYFALLREQQKRSGIFSLMRKSRLVNGAYLWGDVGIGKTFLLDCLYHCLPFQNKLRVHFHAFMNDVHQQLIKHQGEKDPLKIIAKELAKKYLLLCFDEFVVTDIVDAMLLARLLHLLFSCGVCLVTTSNTSPEDLYKRGLQRESFLPAIALIQQHTQVIHLESHEDYRARYLRAIGVFYTPNDAVAEKRMTEVFSQLSNDEEWNTEALHIAHREIEIIKKTDDVIWFDFSVICAVPRHQQDYLAIVQKYKTILISNVVHIAMQDNDRINLFIRMIDVFYDAKIRLIMSSAVAIADIYSEGYMLASFKRTYSRLLEMQSDEYFGR